LIAGDFPHQDDLSWLYLKIALLFTILMIVEI